MMQHTLVGLLLKLNKIIGSKLFLQAIGNAAYTAQQSASLSDSINDSNKKIDTANGEISTLKTTASTIEAAATALTARVSAVETSSTSSSTDLKSTCDKVRI